MDEEENAEEEDDRGEEEAYKQKEEHPEVNGEESGETDTKRNTGENKNELNGNYEHKTEGTEDVDQVEEEELTHLNGKINKDSGGLMEQMNGHDDLQHEEDVKEDYSGSQDQVSICSFSLFFCICQLWALSQLVCKYLTPDKSWRDLNRTEFVGKAFLST